MDVFSRHCARYETRNRRQGTLDEPLCRWKIRSRCSLPYARPSLPCLLLIAIAPDLTSIVDVGESSDWRTPFSSAFVARRAKAVPGVHIARRYSLPISWPPRKCVFCCTRCSDLLSRWVCVFASIPPSFMMTVWTVWATPRTATLS